MTTGFRNSSGTDFDNVFDPYVQGTKPGATGFRTSDGVDLNQRFAPLAYGTAAPATGFRLSGGADVNTLWAAKGTASSALPINGETFNATPSTSGSTRNAQMQFNTNSSGWSVVDANGPNDASGSLPTGAASVKFIASLTAGAAADSVTNGAPSVTSLSSSTLTLSIINTVIGSGSPAKNSTYSITVEYFNSGGTMISSTTFQFVVDAPSPT